MLYAVLICSDEACAEESEAFGELEDFDGLLCAGCGCLLQPLAFAEALDAVQVVHLHRHPATVQLRRAA